MKCCLWHCYYSPDGQGIGYLAKKHGQIAPIIRNNNDNRHWVYPSFLSCVFIYWEKIISMIWQWFDPQHSSLAKLLRCSGTESELYIKKPQVQILPVLWSRDAFKYISRFSISELPNLISEAKLMQILHCPIFVSKLGTEHTMCVWWKLLESL